MEPRDLGGSGSCDQNPREVPTATSGVPWGVLMNGDDPRLSPDQGMRCDTPSVTGGVSVACHQFIIL